MQSEYFSAHDPNSFASFANRFQARGSKDACCVVVQDGIRFRARTPQECRVWLSGTLIPPQKSVEFALIASESLPLAHVPMGERPMPVVRL